MTDKISIIVPVYNVEQYIDKCVESIVNQTYKNIEIILVDDGSPDSCPLICDKWAEKDSRIKVLHKENSGVSSARNAGIDASHGDYIGFVDGDDYINADMFSKLINAYSADDIDLAACGYLRGDRNVSKESTVIFNNTEIYYVMFDIEKHPYFEGFVWNKLYKSEIIKKNNLYFEENLKMCEDTLFNFNYFAFANKAMVIDSSLYNYICRESSVMRVKPVQNDFDMIPLIDRFLSEAPDDEVKKMIVVWAMKYWIKAVDNYIVLNKGENFKNISIGRIKEYKTFILKSDKISRVEKLFAFCLTYFRLPYFIYKKIKLHKKISTASSSEIQ